MGDLTTFFLLRHAETANPGVYHGAESDVGLGERGLQQAKRVAEFLQEEKITRLVSSAMKRAKETAAFISSASKVNIEIEPALHERRVGTLSGTVNNLPDGPWRQTLNRWMVGEIDYAPDGAESFSDIRSRIIPVWKRLVIRHQGERVAVVAHGTVLKVLYLTILAGWNVADWDKMGVIPNIGVTKLVVKGATWHPEYLNQFPPEIVSLPPRDSGS